MNHLFSFSGFIDAEVERAYGVVLKLNFSQMPLLKDEVISVGDRYVATDKLVKRANKIGCTKNTESQFHITAWVEVDDKDGRTLLQSCCSGKCKERQGIAFFRTWAFQVKHLSECAAPMIFFGAPSHNHRGKKAKFILKLALYQNNIHIATSEDVVVPYKQSATISKPNKSLKRQRSESEISDSDVSLPSSPQTKKPTPQHSYNNDKSITKNTSDINTSILSLMPTINYSDYQPNPFAAASDQRALQSYMNNYGMMHTLDYGVPSWHGSFSMVMPYDLQSMWTQGMGIHLTRSLSFPNASFLPIPEDLTSNQCKIESCISS